MFEAAKRWRKALKRWYITRGRDYEALLAEGKRRRQERDWEGAILCYRAAQQKAHAHHVTSTIEQHLRLPLVLQESGRMEEAQREFRRLLKEGYPGQLDNPSVRWHDRSIIYDAIHQAYERDDQSTQAALYAALSFLADAYSRYLDDARDDYTTDMTRLRSRERAEAAAERLGEILSERSTEAISGEAAPGDAVSTEAVTTGAVALDSVADLLQGAISQFGDEDIDAILETVEERLRRQFREGQSDPAG